MSSARRPARAARAPSRSNGGLGGSAMMESGRGADVKVVERQRGLPVVDGQVLVPRTGERLGIGPRQKRAAVDGPIDGAAPAGDREVIASAGLDADVAPRCLAAAAVLLLPAD